MLNNTQYLPGEAVFISDIGPQPQEDHSDPGSTLVCVTTSVSACRNDRDIDGSNRTNGTAGVVGEWFYPNGTTVPHGNENIVADFASYHYTNQIRLAKEVSASEPPLGVFTCEVLDISTRVLYNASIIIQISKLTKIVYLV